MKAGVTTSVVAHAAVLVIALVGLGSARPMEPEMVDSIAVDLVPLADLDNIRAGSLDSKVVETQTPAQVDTPKPAELAKPTGNTEEDQVKPEPTDKVTPAPVVNTAPKPEPTPAPTPEPDPKVEPQPAPTPLAAPEPAPTPEETEPQQEVATQTATTPAQAVAPIPAMRPAALKQAPVKAPPTETKTADATPKKVTAPPKPATVAKPPDDHMAKIADQVADIINSEKSRGAVTGSGGQATLGKTTGHSATLTQSMIGMLSAAMLKCFNPPIAAVEEGATAVVEVHLSRDGMVEGTPVVTSTTGTNGDMTGSAAVRAVINCGQNGYTMLPADLYDGDAGWNAVLVTFKASDAVG